jgi:hypothetical protein
MRTHSDLYTSIARQKLESEKETQEVSSVRPEPESRKQQSIPNAAAIRRTHRDAVLSRTLEFENV